MKRHIAFAFPGNLNLNTGGYAYDRRLLAGLCDRQWSVERLPLGDGFPFPAPEVKREAERRLSQLPDGILVMIDGLAFGILDDWAAREGKRLRIAALIHHPLALETGLDHHQQSLFRRSERRALSFARAVVVTSAVTARELTTHYDVRPDTITVALPGTDAAPLAACDGDPPHIISVGTLTPRKGHDVLIAALGEIRQLSWRATIIGSHMFDPRTAKALRHQVEALGLSGRISLVGECADPRTLLAGADIFALASHYEGYGMAFAEALSQGLPVVACRTGAVPDVVPEAAGLLVPASDVKAFAAAIAALITDKSLHLEKALGARQAGAKLPGWNLTVDTIANMLEALP